MTVEQVAMATENELRSVLDGLPPVQHAFGYGSAVMPQPLKQHQHVAAADGSSSRHAGAGSVVDFVLAVDSPCEWHVENMALNPHHYACHLRMLGYGKRDTPRSLKRSNGPLLNALRSRATPPFLVERLIDGPVS